MRQKRGKRDWDERARQERGRELKREKRDQGLIHTATHSPSIGIKAVYETQFPQKEIMIWHCHMLASRWLANTEHNHANYHLSVLHLLQQLLPCIMRLICCSLSPTDLRTWTFIESGTAFLWASQSFDFVSSSLVVVPTSNSKKLLNIGLSFFTRWEFMGGRSVFFEFERVCSREKEVHCHWQDQLIPRTILPYDYQNKQFLTKIFCILLLCIDMNSGCVDIPHVTTIYPRIPSAWMPPSSSGWQASSGVVVFAHCRMTTMNALT